MQKNQKNISQLAKERTGKAKARSDKDHYKKAFPRKFKVGYMVLLNVKVFLHKNKQKLEEVYKGPFTITRVSKNKMATIKTPHRTKEL